MERKSLYAACSRDNLGRDFLLIGSFAIARYSVAVFTDTPPIPDSLSGREFAAVCVLGVTFPANILAYWMREEQRRFVGPREKYSRS
jgi:hypothetical protein